MGSIVLSELKTRILKIMNEYSVNGEVISDTDENRMDYDLRMNSLIDIHQRRIATTTKKISKSKIFTQIPPVNTLGTSTDLFDITRHTGTTKYYQGTTSAKSYCFKVDGDCIVKIEESEDGTTWTTLTTITVDITTFGVFETYKGNITKTDGYYIRLVFEKPVANTTYNIRSIALYDVKFPTNNDVPVYEDKRLYDMPSDFYMLNYILLNGQKADDKYYTKTQEFGEEGRQKIALPFDMTGEIRIYYWAYPTMIDDTTADTITLDVDDEAVDVIVYGVALDLLETSDPENVIYQRILTNYNRSIASLDNKIVIGNSSVKNVLFSFN